MNKIILTIAMAAVLTIPGLVKAEEAEDKKPSVKDLTMEQRIDVVQQRQETAKLVLSQKLPFDTVYGEEDAPVTIVEYASMSCSHCQAFYQDVFGEIKKNYIDKGKVKLVFRHFPLNINALRGAMILECNLPDDKKRQLLGAMFKAQGEWAYKTDIDALVSKVQDIAKIGGIDGSKFADCVNDKDVENKLLKQQLNTQKTINVSSTPTLFINGEQYFDKKEFETMAKAIDEAIANAEDGL